MSCTFIRPCLPHGFLPSTDWDYPLATNYDSCATWDTADIMDADQLQQNWALLFSKANGMLDGTDFASDSGQFDEETSLVDYEGGATGVWPTVGQRHTHDGIDSSKLADHVIRQTVLGAHATSWGSFGIIRHPAENFHAILITSMAAYDQPSPEAGTAYSEEVAVPYDHKRWGNSHLQRTDVAGRTAFLVGPVMAGYDGWTLNERCAPSMMSVELTVVSNDITVVKAKMQDLMEERAASNWTYGVLALACIAI